MALNDSNQHTTADENQERANELEQTEQTSNHFFQTVGLTVTENFRRAGRWLRHPAAKGLRHLKAKVSRRMKYVYSFAERCSASFAEPFVKFSRLRKELASLPTGKEKRSRLTQAVKNSKHTVCGLLNIAVPAVVVVGAVMLIVQTVNTPYGLAVHYNGDTIAYIAEASDFDAAADLVEQQIIYVEGEDQNFNLTPEFTLQPLTSDMEVVDKDELANRLIQSSSEDITSACGLYVDGTFYGAVEDSDNLTATLNSILTQYEEQNGAEHAEFVNTIVLKDGLYLNPSVVPEKELLNLITTDSNGEQVYTVAEGDNLNGIADKNDITPMALKALNPELEEDSIQVGQQLKVSSAEPFLQVKAIKTITYEEEVAYERLTQEDPNAPKGASAVVQQGQNGRNRITAQIELVNGLETSRVITNTEVLAVPVSEVTNYGTQEFITAKLEGSASVLKGVDFMRPLQRGSGTVSRGVGNGHYGIDWAAPSGTPIYAAADGTVVLSRWYSGYGQCVIIDHGNGVQTLYGHQSQIAVSAGQKVTRGQVIGYVGTTGQSTGNHLHFEIRSNGTKLDPFDYVPK